MENQRIRISKAMLKEGLITLLKEKSLNQITVYELCAVSQINRTTFYKYYGTQMDVLCEIEADFMAQLNDHLKAIAEDNQNPILPVLAFLYEKRALFCLLVETMPAQSFAEHLLTIPSIGIIFQNQCDKSCYSPLQAKYFQQFIFQGTFSVLYAWLGSDKPEPVEEIANVLTMLRKNLCQEGESNA